MMSFLQVYTRRKISLENCSKVDTSSSSAIQGGIPGGNKENPTVPQNDTLAKAVS